MGTKSDNGKTYKDNLVHFHDGIHKINWMWCCKKQPLIVLIISC